MSLTKEELLALTVKGYSLCTWEIIISQNMREVIVPLGQFREQAASTSE